jgi:serine/threonine-protein kinase RsbW
MPAGAPDQTRVWFAHPTGISLTGRGVDTARHLEREPEKGRNVEDNAPLVPEGAQVIEVRTAAIPHVVPTLRTIVADIAMRQDFDLDAVEDLRMAVDEACSLLLPASSDGRLTCVFSWNGPRIEVSVSVLADSADHEDDAGLSWQLLTALATTAERTITPENGRYLSRVDLVRESQAADS